MSRVPFLDVLKHPLLAGLAWAAMFVPTLLLLNWMRGEPVPSHDIPKLIAIAVPLGLVWGVVTAFFTARARDRDAR